MKRKYLKYAIFIVGGLVVLLIAVVAIVLATFDPNSYKPRIVQMVKEKTGRTLAINGEIGIAFFPKIGADIPATTLSERNQAKEFAGVNRLRVYVALLPLLSKRVVVDEIRLEGLRANLVKYKDGKTNFSDLLEMEKKPSAEPESRPSGGSPLVFDVGGLRVVKSHLGWKDESTGRDFSIDVNELTTGRLADKQPAPISLDVGVKASQPKLDLKVKSKGTLTFDLAGKTYRFKDLNVDLGGTASTITLSKADLTASNILLDSAPERVLTEGLKVQAKGKLAADDLDFSLSAPRLDISPDKASSEPAEVNVALNGPERKVKAIVKVSAIEGSRKALNIRSTQIDVDLAQKDTSVKGTVTTPMTVNLDEKIFDLPKIQAEFTLSLPKAPQKTAKLSLSGATRADVGKEGVSGNMIAKIDESTLKANFGVSRFSEPAIRFDVDVDKINVDRYLPPKKDEKGEAPAAKTPAAKTPEKAAEEPIDFSPLKTLDVDGKLRVGALQARNIKVGNLRSDIRAKGGRLAVDPLSADLYEGSTKGDISIDANANRIGVKQNLTGVSIGPLLRDAANKDILEGKGSVSLDVSATGSLVSAMKRTLNGNARIALRNGAVKGIDLAGTVRQVKAALGQKDAEGTASKVEKTDFTEMNASFVIKNGVAHNEDLSLKSPFLRVTGDGNVNIGEDSLDYVVSVAFVETMAGQGGKDLTDLRGLAVPVRLSGPYAALKYRVEFSRMFSSKEQIEAGKELLRNKLGDIGKGLLGGGKEQGQGGEKEKAPPRKPEDALKDALKGLIR